MTANWTEESLQTEVDSKAEVDAAWALAERRARERLVWIDLMQVFMGDVDKANAALAEYIRLWEE